MVWADLFLLVCAGAWVGTRELAAGVLVWVVGLVFLFQARRTRLLLGFVPAHAPISKKIRAAIMAVVLTGFLSLILLEPGPVIEAGGDSLSWVVPALVLLGLFSAVLIIALGVERRQR